MRSYKGWTPQQRQKSLRLTNKAKGLGLLTPKLSCQRCTQTKGIIQWHNENYDITLDILGQAFTVEKRVTLTDYEIEQCESALFTWCYVCHMLHHSKHRNPTSVAHYFHRIDKLGQMDEPVYDFKKGFGILRSRYKV